MQRHLRQAAYSLNFTRSSRNVALGLAAVAALATAPSAFATSYSYIGLNTGDLNSASNWSTGVVPSGAASDTAVFDGTTASGLITLTNSGSTFGAAPGVTLSITSTNDLTLDSATGVMRLMNNNSLTVASGAGKFSLGDGVGTAVSLSLGSTNGTNTFTNNSANTATVNTDVYFANGSNATRVLATAGSGNWIINGLIINANNSTSKLDAAGTFGFSKTGTGTTTLNNNSNFYSANTTVTGGTLKVGANNALGYGGQYTAGRAGGTTTVDGSSAASTLDLGAGAATVNEPIILTGGTNGANLINSTANTTVKVDNGVAFVTFLSGGTTYTNGGAFNSQTVNFTGGGGTGAGAVAYKATAGSTTIATINMNTAGSGYTSAPTVTVKDTGNTNDGGATATATLTSVTLNGTNNNIGGDGNLTINAVIKDGTAGSGFNKIGGGTTTLNAVNTYTGAANVSAGTLLVNGTVGAVNVNGGTLGGNGTVGATTVGTIIAPGNGTAGTVGTLSTANTTFSASGHYAADIGTGTSSDLLAVNGTLDLSATGDTLDLSGLVANFDGSTKTLATYLSLTGTFDAVTLNGAAVGTPASFSVNGQTYALNYGTGTSSAITLTAVPEPASLAGLAIGGLLMTGRRRRQAR